MSRIATTFVIYVSSKRHNGNELPHSASIYCYLWMLFGNRFTWRFIWRVIERERQAKHTYICKYIRYIPKVWGIKYMKDFLHHFFFSVYHHYYLHITSNFFLFFGMLLKSEQEKRREKIIRSFFHQTHHILSRTEHNIEEVQKTKKKWVFWSRNTT